MERRRKLQQGRGNPNDVVALCKAYSQRLKGKPVRVKLHVSSGRLADGTIGLEGLVDGEVAQLVVQAEGSNLFGLVKRKIRHVFKVGELERSRNTHTKFLLRSIRSLSKGDESLKKELLARSLSLVHEKEAVDMTFASEKECNDLGDWIDAKWSVAMIQKSFRGNPRIALALQGKNKTMNDQGVYEALAKSGDNRRGEAELDGAGFARLPVLDRATRRKLQDDLLDGLHVTYHDLSFRGFRSTSSARRLRYDCKSRDGLVYLEPSFEGDGDTIVQPISKLVQVGGGPSAHGPTAALLRATGDTKEQRATAVSLVFKEKSMDITCGTEKDAVELVLYFSEVRGFTRAKPPPRSALDSPLRLDEAGQSPPPHQAAAAGSAAEAAHRAGAAMLNMNTAAAALDVEDALGRSAPPTLQESKEVVAAASDADPLGSSMPSFSTRFRSGVGALERDVSAASGFSASSSIFQTPSLEMQRQTSGVSGFGASASLRNVPAFAGRPGGNADGVGGVEQQRVWSALASSVAPEAGVSPPASSAFTPGSVAAGAPKFRSTPGAVEGAARRSTPAPDGGTPWVTGLESLAEGRSGLENEQEEQAKGGHRHHQPRPHGRQRDVKSPKASPIPAVDSKEHPSPYKTSPPAYDTVVSGGGEENPSGASRGFVSHGGMPRRIERTLGQIPGRHGHGKGAAVVAVNPRAPAPVPAPAPADSRKPSPPPRSKPSDVDASVTTGGGRRNTLALGEISGGDMPKDSSRVGQGRRNTLGLTPGGDGGARTPTRPSRGVGGAGVFPPALPAREGDRSRSPVDRSRSPVDRSRSPVDRSRSPVDRSRSPVDPPRSPVDRSRSPVDRPRSPAGIPRSPASRSRSPAGLPRSTAGKIRSPVDSPTAAAGMDTSVSRGGRDGHGQRGLGSLEDDENYTTFRAKGAAATPGSAPSSDVDQSRYGRGDRPRRASATPALEQSGRHDAPADLDTSKRRSSTPTRLGRSAAGSLGKALRGKLFASTGGGHSGTPSPVSPVPGRRGGNLDSSNRGGNGRSRVTAFFSHRGNSNTIGGVEDFTDSAVTNDG